MVSLEDVGLVAVAAAVVSDGDDGGGGGDADAVNE